MTRNDQRDMNCMHRLHQILEQNEAEAMQDQMEYQQSSTLFYNSLDWTNFKAQSLEIEESLPIPVWPNGDITLDLTAEQTLRSLYRSSWAWRNNRTERTADSALKTTQYICVGVFQCTQAGCSWTLRPMIKNTLIAKQHSDQDGSD